MKALLLSAGYGTRLRPLTYSTPKCLVTIKGKPLMAYWLEMFDKANITPVLINLHYLPDVVTSYIAQSPYKGIIKTVYEKELLGTGGTLLKNRSFFQGEPVFMAHGDNLSVFDMNQFIKTHNQRPDGCEVTMMTFETDHPSSCGIVELKKNGVVCGFHEKVQNPPGKLANGAVYIIEPSVLDFLDSLGKEQIDFSTEVLSKYLGKIYTFHNDKYHRDIGTPESYEKAIKGFLP
ncbi:nucleotidyltransferase family protein [Desulfobacter latus]|uniref:Nucleotidyltransferase family protein n=1 Tax=Desulfobacter latus TaxID=2292 RepID=A0A850TC59_9BACT|nr:nucleotidyltransferase family protein [Desulfobacter latus]NWH04966.1 nucleotidyltransferase family protein [Desulfobacter latus]